MKNHINILLNSAIAILFLGLTSVVYADDIDFLKSEVETESNILFIMDMSGSMKWDLTDTHTIPANPADSRKNILQSALETVLDDPLLVGVNIGIAAFSGDTSRGLSSQIAHGVSYPVSPIDGIANGVPNAILNTNPNFSHKGTSYLPEGSLVKSRTFISTEVPSTWTPHGGTPIVDSLYEAALYFRGVTVDGGHQDPSHIRSAHPSSYVGLLENVTTMVPTNVGQYCGLASQPVCNGTETLPCPTSTSAYTCNTSDASCITAREADGYTCAAPVINNYNNSCNLSQCNANASCLLSSASVNTNVSTVTCGLGNPTACEAANPTYSACQTITNNTPGFWAPGACLSYDDAGNCEVPGADVWNPPTSSSYISCTNTTTSTSYTCPVTTDTRRCEKLIDRCVHTISVDVPHTSLNGTATYTSPIKNECSTNTIILLSDGKPTLNNTSTKVSTLVGAGYAGSCDTGTDYGRCGPELAKFLNTEDQSSITGDQVITTNAIGFALSNPSAAAYLDALATNGGGQFVNADTAGGLVAALKGAVFGGAPRARTFSSPTYTPNPSSMMTHSDFVYLPMFDRGFSSSWAGNLKKFKRANGKLIDADGNIATDEYGGLKDDARDFWSATVPTHVVKSGGAAGNINPIQRTSGAVKVYTDNGSTGTSASFTTLDDSIPSAEFGVGISTADKSELVKFIMGEKADGTARHHMGDIVHSKPIYVSYGAKKVVFIGTNEGYLHAIDDATGQELFAFMPRELLKNIKPQYDNVASGDHIYGVDGEITLWHDDRNSNNVVDNSEKAYLYFGLRRGGKSYYAIDITSRTSPELKWKIDNTTSGFSNLGFTWSQPVLTTMKYKKGGAVTTHPEPLLIFGGGFVDDHASEAENSGTGSDIYVVDALTGEKRWKSPSSAIDYAVPAGIRVLDVDRNGSVDRLYFADTGGYVWRVDFDSTDLTSAKIHKFADLGSVSSPATERRHFFAEPDVALFKSKGRHTLTVSIGSGQRPSPMDASGDDHFFVMFDKHPLTSRPIGTPTITKDNLVDATTSPALNIASSGKKGWYVDLTNVSGEKVLSRAITYDNKIMFSTFGGTSGVAPTAPSCLYTPNTEARLYVLDLLTGGPAIDFDGNGAPEASKKTAVGEIPGSAQVVFNALQSSGGGSCAKDDCMRPDEISVGKGHNSKLPPSPTLRKVYWIDR